MVLLGPSGCGKSTTLRMIAGLEAISSGSLAIDGRVVNDVPAKDRDIAMVFQSLRALSAHDGARQPRLRPAPARHRRRRDRAPRAATSPPRSASPRCSSASRYALSGGQRQRVALGRAIVRDPKVFLFDEPLSNLDASLRVSTRGELIKLHHRLGATMIYVTHDQVEAMTMGSRICIMNDGKVVQIGAPLEVYRRPADTFVAGFLGNPPMNLMPARVDDGRLVLGAARLALPPALLGGGRARRAPDLRHAAGGPGAVEPAATTRSRAEVTAVEPLGAETIATLRIDGSETRDRRARLGRDAERRASATHAPAPRPRRGRACSTPRRGIALD